MSSLANAIYQYGGIRGVFVNRKEIDWRSTIVEFLLIFLKRMNEESYMNIH